MMQFVFLLHTVYYALFLVHSLELKAFIHESPVLEKRSKCIKDYTPTHTISSAMRRKLIYFRIQSTANNTESSNTKSHYRPSEMSRSTSPKSNYAASSPNFTPMMTFSPLPTEITILPDVASTTVQSSTSSLCLPNMPQPQSAPPHELNHQPPIWLTLLQHSQFVRSRDWRNVKDDRHFSNGWMKNDDSSEEFMPQRAARNIISSQKIKKANSEKGDFYASRIERAAADQRGDNSTKLQIVHPPAPNEKKWVMVAGNESAVDGVLSVSLSFGGRLASIGFFYNSRNVMQYYAIMHRFNGPVFLKPDPLTLHELMKIAKENEELELGLTQLCGQDDGKGQILFNTYWERIPGVNFRIWFPGTAKSKAQKQQYEKEGYRLVSICGYSVKNEARYVGVWQKPVTRAVAYEAHFGLSLSECLNLNEKLKAKEYIATQFRVFNNMQDILCAAIWEHVPGHRHFIEIGDNLRQMYQMHASKSSLLPRQISHFMDESTRRPTFVVLWSDVHSFRYPDPPDLWLNKPIPVNYLPGSREQLSVGQLDFISKRVERFMRELDIPGLSVAISRNEQLKFAAGYGYSNVRRCEIVNPGHQFRIGSVSKPITAVAVMILVERGRLRLNQRVFGGADSIFGNRFAKNGQYRKYVTDITVQNLLEHTSGGWNNVDSDPAWLAPSKSAAELVAQVLDEQPLLSRPGQTWIYSNFGYQLLGLIIERVSGLSYERFVLENVWHPVGIKDIRIARSTLSKRSRREVLYYMSGNKIGFNPYEMLPPERTGPWGGWIASPIELLQLMSHIDGFKRKTDILKDKSIAQWAEPTRASNLTYGLGWSLNIMGFNGWQHDGRMPGSASMLVRLDNGLEMAVLVNKEYSARDFFHELGYILHHIGNNCNWWTDERIDLFNNTATLISPLTKIQ